MAATPEAGQAPNWGAVITDVLSEARRVAGPASLLAERLAELGLHGDRGAPYSESAISNWITGRTMPPADVLLAASSIAGISLDQRLGTLEAPRADKQRAANEFENELRELRRQVALLQTQLMNLYARTGHTYPQASSEEAGGRRRRVDSA